MAEEVKVKIFDEEHRLVKEIPVKDIEDQLDKNKTDFREMLSETQRCKGL